MLGKSLITAASGAAGAGETLGIESLFQTWLYTGNGSTQTITNGIDLAGEGGLVWIKSRSAARGNSLFDTARGATKLLCSNQTTSQDGDFGGVAQTDTLTSFDSNGFSLGADANYSWVNSVSGGSHASWTFRKAPKFFDIVTYTGSLSNLDVSHNLGSTPGCIIIKQTNGSSNWFVWHRSTTDIFLNLTNAASGFQNEVGNVTASSFRVFQGASNTNLNASATYVAYIFAHDAGGFGDSGNESVIKCGSFTATAGTFVDLGWEPQWVLAKSSSGTGDWYLFDNMRGWGADQGSSDKYLIANTSGAEASSTNSLGLTPTGFTSFSAAGQTYIYIAIRRGPMKTPTDATKVFAMDYGSSSSTIPNWDSNFAVDFATVGLWTWSQRLTGPKNLNTFSTSAEGSNTNLAWDSNLGWGLAYGSTTLSYMFRRAPGFFDVVAYTGTGSARTVAHNLGVAPELMIVKSRSNTGYGWPVYHNDVGAGFLSGMLQGDQAASSNINVWNNTPPTLSVFSVGTTLATNASGSTFIAYLFATVPGVSKVGSYTGTGTTLNIDCGFTSGARLVLIKRTDSTGDWYVWDTTRGIVSGNDPYLILNSSAAEVTSTDYIDPLSSGFQISSTAPAAINANGGSFIFLAIA